MTLCQSFCVILWKKTSRRMPALFTTTSRRPGLYRVLDDGVRTVPGGDAVKARHSGAAGRSDLLAHLLRRPRVRSLSEGRCPQVVDDDFRTALGGQFRDLGADAVARASDQDDFSFENLHCHPP